MADYDEDLKLALAMSLQDRPASAPSNPTANNQVIDLTSEAEEDDDDDDDELRQAIALSMQQSEEKASENAEPSGSELHTNVTVCEIERSTNAGVSTASNVKTALTFMGLDRKAMEEERLARLGKRKRDPSPQGPRKLAPAPLITQSQLSSKAQPMSNLVALQYPTGVIKRTSATGYPRTNDISIDELLQAPIVHIAVISSFMWDAEWLQGKLDPSKAKQIWIMNAKGQDVQARWLREMADAAIPNLKIHFPPMDGIIHSMHNKFMLLFSKEKLRFIVTTANMTRLDWGEVANDWQPGVMENTVFVIDLPRRPDGQQGDRDELSRFGQELVLFLEQQKVAQNVIDGVLKFDFAQTGHLAFVHSIGGSHKTEDHGPTGLPGLAQAVRDLKLDDVKHIELDYAASSLGAVNDTLLQRLHLAARGESFDNNTKIQDVRERTRIYFPSNDTVKKSFGGPDCGGIISLTRKYYNAPTFPRECLRDYDSTRRGMLSHNKLLFARGCHNDGRPFAWVYVGSANVSESAWGGQKVLKSGQLGSLNIRNWECGIVMPVPPAAFGTSRLDGVEAPPMSVFEDTVEIPFRHPGARLDNKEPWFFMAG